MVDLVCVWSLPVGNWLFVGINGQYWSMWTKSMTQRPLEWPLQKPASHLGEFHSFMCNLYITSSNRTGIQAHLHLTQLCGEESESNQIWQCLDTWHKVGHHSFPSICSNTSVFSSDVLSLCHWLLQFYLLWTMTTSLLLIAPTRSLSTHLIWHTYCALSQLDCGVSPFELFLPWLLSFTADLLISAYTAYWSTWSVRQTH